MDPTSTPRPEHRPAKLVLQRHARPGARAAFEKWIAQLMESATRSSALQGSSVLTVGGGEYFILLRFASQAELDRWESAPDVVDLMRQGDRLATSAEGRSARTGLETWFTLPGMPSPPTAPPKWKMAAVTWLALVPQVLVLGSVVPRDWPVLVQVAVTTAIPVAALTWFVMPALTRRLYRWMYATK